MKPPDSEYSEPMVNGHVGLMANQSLWGNLMTHRALANVVVSGDLSYQLEYCNAALSSAQSYRLLGDRGQLIEEWKFVNRWATKTLDLNGTRSKKFEKLEYKVGMFGGTCFVTGAGKKRVYMDLTDHSRAFELEGMFFKHIDFQSKIHFRCHRRRVNQAILIASILFNPPMTSDASGSIILPL